MGGKRKKIIGLTLTLGSLLLLGGAAAAGAEPDAYDGRWHFQLTPYVWFPAVKGSVEPTVRGLRDADGKPLGPVHLSTQINPDNYLHNLKMAAMLIGEARKDDWSFFTDIIYTDFGNQDTRVRHAPRRDGQSVPGISKDAKTDISSVVWTLGGGYTLVRGPSGNFDLIAGARYLSMSSDLTLSLEGPGGRSTRSHKVSTDESVWDGIVGARGEILFPGTRWFVPYYVDIGAGSSNRTWQAILGAGYRFDWGDASLVLRSLSYDFDKDDADIRFTGPGLGVTFRW